MLRSGNNPLEEPPVRRLSAALATLPAGPLLAHEGHGFGIPALHLLDHGLFALAALAVFGLCIGLRRSGRGARSIRQRRQPGRR
jgi:hypothetical protein